MSSGPAVRRHLPAEQRHHRPGRIQRIGGPFGATGVRRGRIDPSEPSSAKASSASAASHQARAAAALERWEGGESRSDRDAVDCVSRALLALGYVTPFAAAGVIGEGAAIRSISKGSTPFGASAGSPLIVVASFDRHSVPGHCHVGDYYLSTGRPAHRPLAGGELEEQRAVEPAGTLIVDVLDTGGMTQTRDPGACFELLLPA